MKNIKFNEWNCHIDFGKYSNGRIGFDLMDADEGDLVATATVNLPDEHLADDEVAIKDYSENEGMLDALVSAGVVAKPHRHVRGEFVMFPICKLLIPSS